MVKRQKMNLIVEYNESDMSWFRLFVFSFPFLEGENSFCVTLIELISIAHKLSKFMDWDNTTSLLMPIYLG